VYNTEQSMDGRACRRAHVITKRRIAS
jgi:hypothetical protein